MNLETLESLHKHKNEIHRPTSNIQEKARSLQHIGLPIGANKEFNESMASIGRTIKECLKE